MTQSSYVSSPKNRMERRNKAWPDEDDHRCKDISRYGISAQHIDGGSTKISHGVDQKR